MRESRFDSLCAHPGPKSRLTEYDSAVAFDPSSRSQTWWVTRCGRTASVGLWLVGRYDAGLRPTHQYVEGLGAEALVMRTAYGESLANAELVNLRGLAYRVHDGAGVQTAVAYDVKGGLLAAAGDGRAGECGELRARLPGAGAVPEHGPEREPDAGWVRHVWTGDMGGGDGDGGRGRGRYARRPDGDVQL